MFGYLFLMLFIVLAGAIFENLDRHYCINEKTKLGFIVGQNAKTRALVALGIFLVWIALKILSGGASFVDVEWGILAIPLLMLGFVFGPYVGKLWGRRDDLLKAVDRFQENPDAVLKRASSFVNEKFGGSAPAQSHAPGASPPPPPPAATPPAAEPERQRTASDVVDDFTGKR